MTQAPPVIRIAAALAIDGDGRLLLVRKRGTTAFMQPGGKLEPGETPQQALVRELEEELGRMIDPLALMPLGRFSAQAANEPGHMVEAEIFALALYQSITPAAEIEEAVRVTAEQAAMLDLAPLTRDHVLPLFRAGRPL